MGRVVRMRHGRGGKDVARVRAGVSAHSPDVHTGGIGDVFT